MNEADEGHEVRFRPRTDTTTTQQNLGGATDCEPTGAIPDGIDDRAAFQNALDTKHCAIPSAPGVYDISVNLAGVPPVSLRLTGGMRLSGHGPATVLHFYGTRCTATTAPSRWRAPTTRSPT